MTFSHRGGGAGRERSGSVLEPCSLVAFISDRGRAMQQLWGG